MTAAGTGRVCYNGTATGSVAVYACNCPSQYRLVGTGTRTCLSDGTWSGTVPLCLPECRFMPCMYMVDVTTCSGLQAYCAFSILGGLIFFSAIIYKLCFHAGASIPDPPLSGGNDPTVACSSTSSLIAAEYGCSTTHFSTPICGTCQWPEAPTCPGIITVMYIARNHNTDVITMLFA